MSMPEDGPGKDGERAMAKVNFKRLRQGASVPANTITDPRDLFNALPEKVSGLDYLRGPQDQVLAAWHDRRDERDLVIKMNTGGGKTLVGLLIARSWLNEGIRPVAYLVPDDFLTAQVTTEAGRVGIATTNDPRSPEYQQGRAVLVGTFAKLFNGLSVFGVGGSVSKPPSHSLGAVIIDDAHACIAQADHVFRLRVDDDSEAYSDLLTLFAGDLKAQSPNGLLDLEARRRTAIQEVPFWAWQDKQDQVLSILHPISDSALKWGWPLVVDSLPLCTAVITSDAFEIYPPCHPTETLLGFSQAQRRVYLTATLADDSVLVRHFGAAPESVSRPIFPSSAGDIGDRMILVPQQLVPKATDEEVRDLVLDLAEDQNVVVIVPSHARADWWREDAALVLDRNNIHQGVEQLRKNPQLGLVVLINRYDGIDLPGDACHVLVLDGLPEALDGPERLTQARLTGSTNLLGRQIQRLEQGMGRATRSNEDHAVVLLLGARLAERLNAPEARGFFSPATRAQLDLAAEIASEVEADSLDDLHDIMEHPAHHLTKAGMTGLTLIFSPGGQSMKVTRRLALAAMASVFALGVAAPAYAADLIAIITPSHDNPFFKAEAVGAVPGAQAPERPDHRVGDEQRAVAPAQLLEALEVGRRDAVDAAVPCVKLSGTA